MLNETRKKIKDELEANDVILLNETGCSDDEGPAVRLLNSQTLKQSEKKVLVLPADKYKALAELYCTYEFSDRIRMVGGNRQHGSLMNFVARGLLTEEEMFEAVLR